MASMSLIFALLSGCELANEVEGLRPPAPISFPHLALSEVAVNVARKAIPTVEPP